ncbi:MAG: methylenetetrahydrofolate reductase [Bacteroidales bacterium]|nr:methylenetetrahydrofolate reductase [Bacteroidales bacterium]
MCKKAFRIDQYLQTLSNTVFSVELLPPLRGAGIEAIYNLVDELIPYKPLFLSITYHQEEIIYEEYENNIRKRRLRKRPGTVAIAAALRFKYNIEVVPHLICGGFSREETEDALIDLNFLGIHNVLALRGDPPQHQKYFTPKKGGHRYAYELVEQIAQMNKGIFLDVDTEYPTPTNFCIGVAGYPEKHHEAPNIQTDITYLKLKVDKGAHFIITQMFFDNKYFYNFLKLTNEAGIKIPIIPGIKCITNLDQLHTIPMNFHVTIPHELVKEILKLSKPEHIKDLGIEWTVNQIKDLMANGIKCFHFFSAGKVDWITKVVNKVF